MIKAGEIAVLKTSHEEVFVLSLADGKATVRRPMIKGSEINHVVEEYFEPELETIEEAIKRDMHSRKLMRDTFKKLDDDAQMNLAFN